MDTPEKPLSKMNKDELLAEAARLAIEVPEGATNAVLIGLIQAKRDAQTTQEEPTQPRPVDQETGRELDEFGLPRSGPARASRLAELGKPDPRDNPEAWADAASAEQE